MVIRTKLGVNLTQWHQGPGKKQSMWQKPAEKTVTSTANEQGGNQACTASKAPHHSTGKQHLLFTYKPAAVQTLAVTNNFPPQHIFSTFWSLFLVTSIVLIIINSSSHALNPTVEGTVETGNGVALPQGVHSLSGKEPLPFYSKYSFLSSSSWPGKATN